MVKKNYLGGLKLLLLPLFIMLLGMFSTCYADDDYNNIDFTLDFFNSLVDYYHEFASYNNISINSNVTGNILKNDYDTRKNDIISKMNTNNITIDKRNVIWYLNIISNGVQFNFSISNNTIGNAENLSYLVINNQNKFKIYYRFYYGFAYWNSGTYCSATTGYRPSDFATYNESFKYESNLINDVFISKTPFFGVNKKPLNVLEVNNQQDNTTKYYFLENYFDDTGYSTPEEPEQPSGDDGGGGTVTPSGDSGDSGGNAGGFIDYTNQLNDINNNISNSSNNIIQNSNENTDKIINSISGETNKIINNITNTDTDVNVSGELSNMLGSTNNIVDPTVNFFSWLLDNLRSILNDTRQL